MVTFKYLNSLKRAMKNSEIAAILYDIADILEMQNIQFKPNAYRKAARSVETLTEQVSDIYGKDGFDALKNIPGVGESIAEKIEELVKTGKLKYYQELRKKLPKHISELMEVPGMGPKKIKKLHEKLKIADVKSLEKAAKTGKISRLEGFGKKSEEDILKGIELLKRGHERMLLWNALQISREIEERLKGLRDVIKIVTAGSLRRRKETIGDLDILITSKAPEKVMDFFTKMKDVERVLAKGSTKSSVLLDNGLQIDLRVLDDSSFGAALQYFTGSKEHNVAMREIAIKKGLKVNEYGVFRKKDNKKVAGKTEEEVYKAIGMEVMEPEIRENNGELEAASKGNLPKLIPYGSIKGDFHVHTKKSDGNASIKEMAEAAKKLGYEYVAITDHSKSERIAHGLSEEEMLKHIEEIRKVSREIKGIKIFAGAEVDILPDGSLDYSENVLKKLDIVVVSVHSRFKSSKEEMTTRIIKALSNKYADILAHPTGRLISRREPYEADLSRIFGAAAKNNVLIEVNAQPERMDLKDAYIKEAKKSGVKFVVNTDSHSISGLNYMEPGIAMARRGWLEAKDVVNTRPLKELPKFFKRLKL